MSNEELLPTTQSVAALLRAGNAVVLEPATGGRFTVRVTESEQHTVTVETLTVQRPPDDELPVFHAPWRTPSSGAHMSLAATGARAVRCYASSARVPTRATVDRYG